MMSLGWHIASHMHHFSLTWAPRIIIGIGHNMIDFTAELPPWIPVPLGLRALDNLENRVVRIG